MSPAVRIRVRLLAALLALGAPRAAQQSAGGPRPDKSPVTIALFGAHPRAGEAPLRVQFVDRSFGGVTSWSWDFGDGGTSALQDPAHVYTEGGVYAVTLAVRGPHGPDTRTEPQGVIVRSCTLESARDNRPSPLERGEDFVPITGDDSLGFYCVYSGKAVGPSNPGIANNVGMFVLPLANGEVLLFGSGYGDPNSFVDPTEDASFDVRRIDAIIRFCLGRTPASTPIRFVAPHGHIDHINADCMRELRARGYPISEISFHNADAGLVTSLPGWTGADRSLFRGLRNSTAQCQEELKSFASPLGKLWFHLRAGHTPGSIDLVIDVQNDPGNRFVIRGSGESFGACPIENVREAIEPHGNIQLTAPVPELLGASPASGSSIGGTQVVLTGRHLAAPLAGTPLVLFDGAPATAVSVLDDDTLTCVAPSGMPGRTARLHLVNQNGQATLDGAFTYRPLPTLDAVAPVHGLVTGGTRVTLTGSGFQAGAPGPNLITFGGVPGTAVAVVDDAHLSCTTPPGSAGTVDVVLSNLNGAAELRGAFLYDPVIDVTSVTPATGTSRGGTRVTLGGSAFAVGASLPQVFFGSGRATEVERLSDTQLACTTPAGPQGSQVDVRVSGENGSDTLPNGFRYYAAPKVTSLSPASGPAGGGTQVTLTGNNFTRNGAGANTVTFDGLPAGSVVTLSDTSIRCTTPSGTAGASVAVAVSNANGTGSLDAGYRYHRAPVLTAVEPGLGPPGGGTLVTVRGSAFAETGAGATSVRFGGASAGALTIVDDETATCTTPALGFDGPVDVELDNANGHALLPLAFRYATRPELDAVAPPAGPARGGATVTLLGRGFLAAGAGAPEVLFGRVRADAVRVVDDATLSCVAPPGAPGSSVAVSVRNLNGRARLEGAFRYLDLPALELVQPGEGPLAGGTRVALQGSGFLAGGAPRVRFGTALATSLVVRSDDRLECTTPPGAHGAVSVRVETIAGSALLRDGFVYGSTRPEVQRLEPDHGSSLAPPTVVVHGANFLASQAGPNRVSFGGLAAGSVVTQGDDRLVCDAPAGAPGARVDVQVSNANGSALLVAGFRYHLQPALGAVSPAEGSPLGGLPVTVTGAGFLVDDAGPPSVRFGGLTAGELVVLDDAHLTCSVPPGAPGATVALELANANGSARLDAAFRYLGAPTLDGLAPVAGSPLGGTSATLTGSGFALGPGVPLVRFGGVAASAVSVLSDASLSCTVPPGTAGAQVDVEVETANGSTVLAAAYRYFAAPLITALAPDHGPGAGGTTVVLTGSGFKTEVTGANAVTFGGRPARSVTTVDDTRVRAVAPLGPAGERVDVVLTNSNGSASVLQGFRYHAAPVLTALSPGGASALGGASVTLTGSGFQRDGAGTNRVSFGATQASAVTLVDDLTLLCTVPPGSAGTSVDVTVSNNNGTSAPVAFELYAAPRLTELVPPFGFSGGGTLVELHGSGFLANAAGPPGVSFGAASASEIVVADDALLLCRAPAGVLGSVAVTLGNANGTAVLPDGYYYDWAPTVTGFQPASGTALGGTEVRVSGGGFATPGAGALSVRFGTGTATNLRVLDGQTLLCDTPSGPAGTSVGVLVANTHGSSSLPGFRYHARPTLTSVTPALGPPEGGTQVTLTGTGFSVDGAGTPAVTFGSAAASAVVVVDDGTVRCLSPAGPARTSATVALANQNGAASIADGFRWLRRDPSDLNDDGLGDAALAGADGVYLFFGGAGLLDESTSTADLVLRASISGVDFGNQVASGDLNGDRIADLAVAAPLDDAPATDAGAVFVFFGPLAASPSPRGSSTASAVFRGASAGDRFGSGLLVADVSGDGTADLVVGAPFNDVPGTDGGAVYVYRGSGAFASQTTAQASVRLLAAGNQHNFGAALGAGDLDGDQRLDLVVGAPTQGAAGGNSGAAYVFRGGSALVSTTEAGALVQLSGAGSGDHFGSSAGAADMDGDGIDDLVLGAPDARNGGNQPGAVYVFRGGSSLESGSAADASAVLEGEVSGDRLGQALALGDADGDGRADLLTGAPQFDLPATSAGRAYLVKGGAFASGPIAARAFAILTAENSVGDGFGTGLGLTDLDGDGRADLLIGSPFSNGGGVDSGRVHVFLGSGLQATRAAAADDVTYTGASAAQVLGRELGSAR